MIQDAKIYLIFEYLTMDLRKFLDTNIPKDEQMNPMLVKSYLYQVIFYLIFLRLRRVCNLSIFSYFKASYSVTREEFCIET